MSIADHVILANKSAGRDVLFTLPMLGWIPKDGEKRWAFSVKKYGAQQKTEPYDTDAGNGLKPSGETLTGNDPEDTSMRISPDWHVAWLAHMREILGGKTAANGGMRFFALDNEPDLWSSTHRDLRQGDAQLKTVAVGRDELWGRTVAYATALKKADPALQITGPVVGTWCGYFGSGEDIYDADGDCKTGGDRTSHEGLPFLQWYLRQICAHEKKTGLRLVDYLDVHYYPEDLDLRAETAPVARDRLERVRALYDAGFQDPSWIRDAVQLIPRLRGWIAAECPGTKLAVTEYRFGYENDSLSSTLAQAEALLVFGRDGVDLATTWGEIKSGGLYEGAFRLFLDYDGQGANARSGQSLRVEEPKGVKPERDPVLSYAIGVEKRVLVYLLNKSPLPRTKRLALDAGLSNARQFVLDTTGLAKTKIEAPSLDGRVTSLSVSLPPASMTLVELTP